jgi:hypothetical protein
MTVTVLQGLPENVLGIEAAGEIEDDDYEDVILPAVARILEQHDKVRVIYVLGDDFEKFDAEAAWEDAKMGLRHFGNWERIAFVTDHPGYRRAVKMFGFLMPGDVQVFPLAEQARAEAWIAAS